MLRLSGISAPIRKQFTTSPLSILSPVVCRLRRSAVIRNVFVVVRDVPQLPAPYHRRPQRLLCPSVSFSIDRSCGNSRPACLGKYFVKYNHFPINPCVVLIPVSKCPCFGVYAPARYPMGYSTETPETTLPGTRVTLALAFPKRVKVLSQVTIFHRTLVIHAMCAINLTRAIQLIQGYVCYLPRCTPYYAIYVPLLLFPSCMLIASVKSCPCCSSTIFSSNLHLKNFVLLF